MDLGFYKWGMTSAFRGFNSYTGFYSGGEDYMRTTCAATRSRTAALAAASSPPTSRVYTAFTSDAVAVCAEARCRRTAAAATAAAKPMFLYLAYQGVHAPAEASAHYVDAYRASIKDTNAAPSRAC